MLETMDASICYSCDWMRSMAYRPNVYFEFSLHYSASNIKHQQLFEHNHTVSISPKYLTNHICYIETLVL